MSFFITGFGSLFYKPSILSGLAADAVLGLEGGASFMSSLPPAFAVDAMLPLLQFYESHQLLNGVEECVAFLDHLLIT